MKMPVKEEGPKRKKSDALEESPLDSIETNRHSKLQRIEAYANIAIELNCFRQRNLMIELLKLYRDENDHASPTKNEIYQGRPLGLWVDNQRREFQQLSQLEFDWNSMTPVSELAGIGSEEAGTSAADKSVQHCVETDKTHRMDENSTQPVVGWLDQPPDPRHNPKFAAPQVGLDRRRMISIDNIIIPTVSDHKPLGEHRHLHHLNSDCGDGHEESHQISTTLNTPPQSTKSAPSMKAPALKIDNDGVDLDREITRLESFEAYVLVSVLTASASFAVLHDMELNSDTVLNGCYSMFLVCVYGISAIAGLHATVVFSLCLLYGKTALGMNKDSAYQSFIANVASQRMRAFQTLKASLSLFGLQIVLAMIHKAPEQWRPVMGVLTLGLLYANYLDAASILEAAGVIFAPPPKYIEEK